MVVFATWWSYVKAVMKAATLTLDSPDKPGNDRSGVSSSRLSALEGRGERREGLLLCVDIW